MRILIVGEVEKAVAIEEQLIAADIPLGYAPNEMTAAWYLKEIAVDVVLLINCEKLEETDLVAEELKRSAMAGPAIAEPYVFVLWSDAWGFDSARGYGLRAIDILMEDFSPRRCEQAFRYAQHNEL